jgi:hypothetical protein
MNSLMYFLFDGHFFYFLGQDLESDPETDIWAQLNPEQQHFLKQFLHPALITFESDPQSDST